MASIHIFTSSKGGVGKTLQALCASTYFIKNEGDDVLICDFNFFNSDLFQILGSFADEGSEEQIDGFNIKTISKYGGPRVRLLYPTDLYQIPGNMPFGFYSLLAKAVSIKFTDFSPYTCIVDTGFHFANLDATPEKMDKFKNSEEMKFITHSLIDKFTPYFWFTWTLACFNRKEEREAILTSSSTLENIFNSQGENWYRNTANLIHVINPHALMADHSWKKMISDAFKRDSNPNVHEIDSLLRLSERKVMGNIALKYFFTEIMNSVLKVGESMIAIEQSSREEDINRFVAPIIENQKARPKNFFPIPYFDESLAGYTDSLALKRASDIGVIEDKMGKILPLIQRYISEL